MSVVHPPSSNVSCRNATKDDCMGPIDFFQTLYGEDPLPGSVVITRFAPRKESVWCLTIEDAAQVCDQWSGESDVYHGIGLRGGDQPHPGARGDSASVIALPGFGRDLDYGVKPTNDKVYPPTRDAALALLEELPRRPNLIVNSGACLHVYWLFSELWELLTADDRQKAFQLSRGLSRLIERTAKAHSWCIDATFDLARVLRPVGTLNHQHGHPRPVTLLQHAECLRWLPADFEEFLVSEAGDQVVETVTATAPFRIPQQPIPPTDLGEAFRDCFSDRFFRDCWNRKIKVGDGSPSVYTFVIGSRMFDKDATSQQMVDAMVSWRLAHDGNIESHHWYEQELQRIAAKAASTRTAASHNSATSHSPPALSPITVGNAVLKPGQPRQTPSGVITIPLVIAVAGKDVDHVPLRSSIDGRSKAAKAIASHTGAGCDAEITAAFGTLLVTGKQVLESPSSTATQTVRKIVAARIPGEFRLSHRTSGGAWSEYLGREVTRSEFLAFTPDWLVTECAMAADAHRSQPESALLRTIVAALGIVWATELEHLPALDTDAITLDRDSAAGRKFRLAIVKTWTKLVTMEVTMRTDRANQTENRASRTSLAGRVQSAITEGISNRSCWIPVQKSIDAWYRSSDNGSDFPRVLLAMRYTLPHQIGVEVPGATSQRAFKKLGTDCGVFSDGIVNGVRVDRATGGDRLAVLSLEMTAEILVEPQDDEPEPVFEAESDDETA